MYTLDGTDLADFGFQPGKAPGSNLALAGAWDMPARTGLTGYSWGDEAGQEPYIDADQIFFEGRDLTLYGIVVADSADACLTYVNELTAFIDTLTDLVDLVCDWGTFSVYVRDRVQAQYLDQGVAVVTLTFREPVVDMSEGGTLPTYTPALTGSLNDFHDVDGFDGDAFADWGLILKDKRNYLIRPETKTAKWRKYGAEGYQITKPKDTEADFTFLVKGADYATFKSYLNTFQKYLKAAGLRYITQGEVSVAGAWCKDGFKVSEVNSQGGFTATLELKLILVPYTPDPEETMLDSDGEAMMDLDSELMLDVGS